MSPLTLVFTFLFKFNLYSTVTLFFVITYVAYAVMSKSRTEFVLSMPF